MVSRDSEISSLIAAKEAKAADGPQKKKTRPPTVWLNPEGNAMDLGDAPKMDLEVLRYANGEELQQGVQGLPSAKTGKRKHHTQAYVVKLNPEKPLPGVLQPSSSSPLCKQCKLFTSATDDPNGKQPFMPFLSYVGADKPLVTIIFNGPTASEAHDGAFEPSQGKIYTVIKGVAEKTGVRPEDIRWLGLTRCYAKSKNVNFKIKGNWCRYHVVDDLRRHPPRVIIPVGTAALGALCHKSNAQDWGGKVLTYRGWPDDWLTNPKYVLPQPDPSNPTKMKTGHPVFGKVPTTRTLLCPIQVPSLILMQQNKQVTAQWCEQIFAALRLAKTGAATKSYVRPWYDWSEDPVHIEQVLDELLQHPGILLAYDTETTGLLHWAKDAAIVSIMFRWTDPATGEPRSLGFPWQTKAFGMWKHIPRLQWKIWDVLCQSTLIGHNLTFDVLYTYSTFFRGRLHNWDDPEWNKERDAHLRAFTQAACFDTWHMTYTSAQRRGSLGLEIIAYTYVPDLAGYEEDMTLLIELHGDKMNPANGKGGHYLNVPKDKVQSHLVPYVMGDVEVAYKAHEKLTKQLECAKTYKIPLAAPSNPGYFRWFATPRRDWVYNNIMSPASRMLMQMMARGMYVDQNELELLEKNFPAKITTMRKDFTKVDPRIIPWIERKERENPGWALDLESKDHLRELLFDVLGIIPDRLTKGGKKLYGDTTEEQTKRMVAEFAGKNPNASQEDVAEHIAKLRRDFAAIDKFTLNAMAVEHTSLRSLLEYRKVFKLYTTYVRPLRNYKSDIDKKDRKKDPHLCYDSCIHASFLLTGTRGGRLCVAGNTQLCVRIEGHEELVAIKDVWMYRDRYVTVKTHRGRWRRISRLYSKGHERMYAVTTEGGSTVVATLSHRFYTPTGWHSLGTAILLNLRLYADTSGSAQASAIVASPNLKDIPAFSASDCVGVRAVDIGHDSSEATDSAPTASTALRSERIVRVQDAGVQEVWDIEVEEDHSYVAQGLVHHNSCKNPNLQQLPRDGEVKSMFVSRFGERGCLYQGDLSQIELRLMAAACGDPTMVKAYMDKVDLHSLTTSRIFKVPYEHFSKDHMKFLQSKKRDKEAKDLDQKRNIGKCVDPATLISVNGKITRIGNLHAGRQNDTFYPVRDKFVQTPSGNQPIRSFYCNGVSEQLLVTARKSLIVCSPNHRLALADGTMIRACDLAPGMLLSEPEPMAFTETAAVLPIKMFGVDKPSPAVSLTVTPELAYCLGLFYGDGTCNVNSLAITTGGKPEYFPWQDTVAEALTSAGFSASVVRTDKIGPTHKKEGKFSVLNGASGKVIFGSCNVLDLFEQLGAITALPGRKRTLRIPEWLFNAQASLKLQFLGGLIDTDGYGEKSGSLRICTKCPRFAQDIMTLIRTLGLRCRVEDRWNKNYERYYYVVSLPKIAALELKPFLRNPVKTRFLTPSKFSYRCEKPNAVVRVTASGPGELVDISLDNPHVYLIDGIKSHNTVNFLTGYGGGAFGLQNVLAAKGIFKEIEECEEIIELFFESYPSLRALLQLYKGFILNKGCAVSIFGRVRVFEEAWGEDEEAKAKALRAGCNHLIQSTASDMMLVALFVIERRMREMGLESLLISTVHDSLLIDAIRAELPVIHDIVTSTMNNFPVVLPLVLGNDLDTSWMLVPFTCDCDVGRDYLSVKKIPEKDIDWDKLLAPNDEKEKGK